VPEPADNTPPEEPQEVEGTVEPGTELAEVHALPAIARPIEIIRPRPASLPATVVAATGGFLLGVAAFVLVKVLRRARPARLDRGRRRRRRGGDRVEVAHTRSFLIDVHLLDRR
jgi:hypothetical protein